MANEVLTNLLALRDGPRDGALLRMSIANALLRDNRIDDAVVELRAALRFDPRYSAAWKLLGKTLVDNGDVHGGGEAYRAGIAAADARGDKQASREMQVFLKRLDVAS